MWYKAVVWCCNNAFKLCATTDLVSTYTTKFGNTGSAVTQYTYDQLGRPINYMGKAMTWDKAGNLAKVGTGVSYSYLSNHWTLSGRRF